MTFPIVLFTVACCIGSSTYVSAATAVKSTAAATTVVPISDVTLALTPSMIKCSFTPNLANSEIASLMTLTLSRSPVPDDDLFNEVAMVTAFGGNGVNVKDTSIGGVATGGISGAETVILFEWHYPDKAAPGKYKCEAFGLDKQGHPLTSSSVATLVTASSDLTAAIHEIDKLQVARNECLAQASDWQNSVWGTLHEANSTEYNVTGHRYYLSQVIKVNVTYATQTCGLFGGYLAEIEDQGEYDFVISFLGDVGANGINQFIQVGGSDIASEGSWVFPHSGDVVKFFKWSPLFPKNTDAFDCFTISANWRYTDPRYHRGWSMDPVASGMQDSCCDGCVAKRFLCEIP